MPLLTKLRNPLQYHTTLIMSSSDSVQNSYATKHKAFSADLLVTWVGGFTTNPVKHDVLSTQKRGKHWYNYGSCDDVEQYAIKVQNI